MTVGDLSGLSDFDVKLWDGTTVIASVHGENVSPNYGAFSLSGIIASPAGNLRISVAADVGGSKCVMYYNASGFSADCTITAVRIG